jgi:hypothetical protein
MEIHTLELKICVFSTMANLNIYFAAELRDGVEWGILEELL